MYFLKYCDIKCCEAHVCCIYCLEYSGCEVPIFCSYKATIQLHSEIRGTLDPKKQKILIFILKGKTRIYLLILILIFSNGKYGLITLV